MTRRIPVLAVSTSLTLLLSACGGSPPPPTETAATATAARAPIASWQEETFGPLRVGMSGEQVIAALGEPESRPEFVEMQATGERIAQWSWPAHGVSLAMYDGTDGAVVGSMTLSAPSELRGTYGGVGLGSTRAEVLAAYADVPAGADDVVRDDPESPDQVRLGDAYACFTFHLTDDGRVSSVFMGSTGAE